MRIDHESSASRIHADLPVVDGHNDLPWALRTRNRNDLGRADPRHHLEGFHTDIPRLVAGGVGAQFWSVFVPAWTESPLAVTLEQIDLVEDIHELAPESLTLANTATDVRRIRRAGRTAGLIGAEGGHCIEGSLDALRLLRRRGVRYLTLTHGDTIDWADSATDQGRSNGLSPFGVEVVHEMNRLGMIVDISHVAMTTMRDALDATERPLMASHSNAYALAPHPRNIPDDVIDAIGANDGVVMVNFYPAFVVPETAEKALDIFARDRNLRSQYDDDEAFEEAVNDIMTERNWDRGGVADVADHIEHIARVAGVDHVGLGSDFDGINMTPVGLEDVSCYPAITVELLNRGWDEPDIRKVLGENALRVIAAND